MSQYMTAERRRYITIRTQFEGFHHYPGAGNIDERIEFLEHRHRHMFHVEVTISVTHADRDIEFFLAKWALNDFLKASEMDNKSCEMIAEEIIDQHLTPTYGVDRFYAVTVSEDGESDGIVEHIPTISN